MLRVATTVPDLLRRSRAGWRCAGSRGSTSGISALSVSSAPSRMWLTPLAARPADPITTMMPTSQKYFLTRSCMA